MLIGLSVVINLHLMQDYPHRTVLSDERAYVAQAGRHAKDPWTTLLPGNLEFSRRPPLFGHVLSRVAPRHVDIGTWADFNKVSRKTAARQLYLQQARKMHIVFHAVLCVLLFLQARVLGLSILAALVAPLLLTILPRHLFHIHGMWSELLHMVLQAAGMTALIYAIRRRLLVWLALPAGIAYGFAVLTRTTSLFFIPFAPILFIAASYIRNKEGRMQERTMQGLAMSFLFLFSFLAVLTPQVYRNIDRGLGPRIAANNWLNVRQALQPRANDGADYQANWRLASQAKSERAAQFKRGEVQQELQARAQVMDFVDRQGFWSLVPRQIGKAWRVLSKGDSQFKEALTMWVFGPDRARELRPFADFDYLMWYTLVLTGLLGLLFMCVRTLWLQSGSGWLLIGAYVGYYLVALCGAPNSARMAYQLAPFLCMGTAALFWLSFVVPFQMVVEASERRMAALRQQAAAQQSPPTPEPEPPAAQPGAADDGASPEGQGEGSG